MGRWGMPPTRSDHPDTTCSNRSKAARIFRTASLRQTVEVAHELRVFNEPAGVHYRTSRLVLTFDQLEARSRDPIHLSLSLGSRACPGRLQRGAIIGKG